MRAEVHDVLLQLRSERDLQRSLALHLLRGRQSRILITGAAGGIGCPLTDVLRTGGVSVVPTDVDTSRPWGCTYMDVTNFQSVLEVVAHVEPDLIIPCAAAKHAPAGEDDPWSVASINVVGTWNVLNVGRRAVLASTCKAIEPETAYGASKLLAERMVLNAGGSVARFYNVPETGGGNVVDAWLAVPDDEPLPVTPCHRFLLTLDEAVDLLLWSAILRPGRYRVDPGEPVGMAVLAELLFPGRELVDMRPRRGDRLIEPEFGTHEWPETTQVNGIDRVGSWHDS